MRLHAAVLAAVVLSGCGNAAALTPSSPPGDPPTPILTSEGGVLRPIANGGRIALMDGSATVTFDPYPIGLDGRVRIETFDGSGSPRDADVTLMYESIDMDMGQTTEKGGGPAAVHGFPLQLDMPGAWRLVFTVTRAGAAQTVRVVLPQVP